VEEFIQLTSDLMFRIMNTDKPVFINGTSGEMGSLPDVGFRRHFHRNNWFTLSPMVNVRHL